jgi:hypothetical protein
LKDTPGEDSDSAQPIIFLSQLLQLSRKSQHGVDDVNWTANGNDHGYEGVFSRQLQTLTVALVLISLARVKLFRWTSAEVIISGLFEVKG